MVKASAESLESLFAPRDPVSFSLCRPTKDSFYYYYCALRKPRAYFLTLYYSFASYVRTLVYQFVRVCVGYSFTILRPRDKAVWKTSPSISRHFVIRKAYNYFGLPQYHFVVRLAIAPRFLLPPSPPPPPARFNRKSIILLLFHFAYAPSATLYQKIFFCILFVVSKVMSEPPRNLL